MDTQLLLLAVIQSEDSEAATQALTQAGLRVTRISSMGGFLRAGNVALLLGLARDETTRAIEILTTTCHDRTTFVNAAPEVAGWHAGYIAPLEVWIGGATIFALPVERFARFGTRQEIAVAAGQEDGMKLIIAITPQEQSSDILDALMAAEYRATLISTTGGFMRKGNATLLIGVEANQVADALKRIEDVCAAVLTKTNLPTSCATVFVLNTEQYKQV